MGAAEGGAGVLGAEARAAAASAAPASHAHWLDWAQPADDLGSEARAVAGGPLVAMNLSPQEMISTMLGWVWR